MLLLGKVCILSVLLGGLEKELWKSFCGKALCGKEYTLMIRV